VYNVRAKSLVLKTLCDVPYSTITPLDRDSILRASHNSRSQVGALHLDLRAVFPCQDKPLRSDEEVAHIHREQLDVRREEDVAAVAETDDAGLSWAVRLSTDGRRDDVADGHHVVVLKRVVDAVDRTRLYLVLTVRVQLSEAGEEVRFEEVIASRRRTDRGNSRLVLRQDRLFDVLIETFRKHRRVGLHRVHDGRVKHVLVEFDGGVDDRGVDRGDAFGVRRERDAGRTSAVGGGRDSTDVREENVSATGTEPTLSGVGDEVDYATDIIRRVLDLVGPQIRDKSCGGYASD
jgi:hypothetical protein